MLFDKNFKLLDFNELLKDIVDDEVSLTFGEDIREIVWSFIGLEEELLALFRNEKKLIHIPMILKNDHYYDLDIEILETQEGEKLFIAYFIYKSKNSIEYIEMIKEINKKTLINETSKDQERQMLLNKELISFTVDLDGIIVALNDALAYFLHLEKDKIQGSHFSTFFQTRNLLLEDKNIIFTAKNPANKVIYFNATVLPLTKNGKIYENMIICQDISYLQEVKKKLEYVSEFDTLTALPNKNYLLQEIDRHSMVHKSFVIAYIDIKNFTEINKEYGFHAGDMLLKHIAKLLEDMMRVEDIVARIGSNQFAVLFQISYKNLLSTLERIKHIPLNTPLIYSKEDKIDFSFYMVTAQYPEEAENTQAIMEILEKKMLREKVQ
jgi:diguanylate cyclase (GGDEF)-like protein